MRRLSCGFLLVLVFFVSQAQISKSKARKYPSLFWEITGNGLHKPSYLFGTMHVSSKMVFNLSDSFYLAIRNADVVALETNPESWQEDMFRFNFENDFTSASYQWAQGLQHAPEDYLTINTLKFTRYEKLIETALASNPSAINNLLYRTNSEREIDFEEDTYLDLYIYQAGKKWGKKVFGVENYAESMKLAMEAYMDAMKDKNKKEKTYETDEDYSYAKLQDAYRTGNLDLLDTINQLNSFSPAFDEKFLYRRNEIQAASIDSILKNKLSLFVGVGAAHLPGNRGVIELLRREGYKLRPIKMGERNSRYKDDIEQIKVPVAFARETAEDGFYSVEVPGKLYRFNNSFNGFDQKQNADMANGSYYIVTRIQTNASAWGAGTPEVFKKVDSLLYENIPGKILSKKIIIKNGYRGFDIVNKTRRGDHQRYNIFVTPFEVLFFKVSGNGEYVKANNIADRFFNSIQLKEYAFNWKKITPAFAGFEVEMPHEPYVIRNKNWQFLAHDKTTDIDFEVIRTDVHNYNFAEVDSFDLNLMEESFTASDFFGASLSRKQTIVRGYPALDSRYRYKDGSMAMVRYIIQGPHYYTLVAHGDVEHPKMMQFLNSFKLVPFLYREPRKHTDTSLLFSVTTPFYPPDKNSLELPKGFENIYNGLATDGDNFEKSVYRDKLIANDSTGEKIYVSYHRAPRYEELKDSLDMQENEQAHDKTWIVKKRKITEGNEGLKIWESVLTDSNSSRSIRVKTFYRNEIVLTVKTQSDTLTRPSSFVSNFFETVQLLDTLKTADVLKRKSEIFFDDFFGNDTSAHKRAIHSINTVTFDAADLPQIKKAIDALNWEDKNYLDAKKDFIDQLGTIPNEQTSLYLQHMFYEVGDTVDLQYKILENLLAQQTKFSFGIFRDIVVRDPPVLNISLTYEKEDDYNEESFLEGLYDSLELTSSIANDLFPLVDIDDYKYPLLELMSRLVRAGFLSYKDYESYSSKFLLEAKQAWKKQVIMEKARAIETAQKNSARRYNRNQGFSGINNRSFSDDDDGNETLSFYADLLMPMWEKNNAVPQLLKQLLNSSDKQLRYKTMLLFIRNERKLPDSIIYNFAANHDYRYDLYNDLSHLKKLNLFPSQYKNQLSLATSKLYHSSEYSKPDSVVFLKTFPLQWSKRDGVVYFFNYRRKKDDVWKIASVGLLHKDSTQFEYKKEGGRAYNFDLDFTEFSDLKFREDEPMDHQLQKRLKEMMYAKRASAREFYQNKEDDDAAYRSFSK